MFIINLLLWHEMATMTWLSLLWDNDLVVGVFVKWRQWLCCLCCGTMTLLWVYLLCGCIVLVFFCFWNAFAFGMLVRNSSSTRLNVRIGEKIMSVALPVEWQNWWGNNVNIDLLWLLVLSGKLCNVLFEWQN